MDRTEPPRGGPDRDRARAGPRWRTTPGATNQSDNHAIDNAPVRRGDVGRAARGGGSGCDTLEHGVDGDVRHGRAAARRSDVAAGAGNVLAAGLDARTGREVRGAQLGPDAERKRV